jgi:DNA-binding winged helix-turn-helix (wHTH) protein
MTHGIPATRYGGRDGARRIALSGSKVHTALAVLLLARGRVVSDGRLSELLWGWDPPATMNAQIYTYISRLRKLLGPGVDLVRRQPGYQLTAAGARIDVLEFEYLDQLGRKALKERRFEEAASVFRRALNLWQGPALSNVTPYLARSNCRSWRRHGQARSNTVWTPTWNSPGMSRSSPNSSVSSPSSRCGSGSGPS